MLIKRMLFWVVFTLFSLPSYSGEKLLLPLLDGGALSRVKLSYLKDTLEPDTLTQRGKNRFYLFSFHTPTSDFPSMKFDFSRYQERIEDLNRFAAERAARQAAASKIAPADLEAKPKRRRTSIGEKLSLACGSADYFLGKAYLKHAFDQVTGYLVLQVTSEQGRNYLTGIGTLHPFHIWVENFAWSSTQNPFLSKERREVEDWLRNNLPPPKSTVEKFRINKIDVLLPKTTYHALGEVGVLSAIGGGSTILDHLECQAAKEEYTGIIISSLKTAVGFYQHKKYHPIASPSACHLLCDTTEAEVVPYYCHPISSVEFVTCADASTFLVKKLPLQPLMLSQAEKEEEPVSPRLRKKPRSTKGNVR